MIVQGSGSNGLAIVFDYRFAEDKGSSNVFTTNRWLRRPLKDNHGKALRVAVREANDPLLTSADLRQLRPDFLALLREKNIKAVVIVSGKSHEAWQLVSGRGGSSHKWTGTVFLDGPTSFYQVPIMTPWLYEPIFQHLTDKWLKMALALARGNMWPFQWPELVTENEAAQTSALEAMLDRGEPLAVDIETSKDRRTLTAIALADSQASVSVPWDTFKTPFGKLEEGLLNKRLRNIILYLLESKVPKILHNGQFDVTVLGDRDIKVNNYQYDTLLMHRTAYPQFPHDLQFAAATEICVEPWKSTFKAPSRPRDIDKADWDPYMLDGSTLRHYNAQDAAILVPLNESLKRKVGL